MKTEKLSKLKGAVAAIKIQNAWKNSVQAKKTAPKEEGESAEK